MTRAVAAALGLVALATLLTTGCSSVVDGRGANSTSPSGSSARSPDFPAGTTGSGGPQGATLSSTPPTSHRPTDAQRRSALAARAGGTQVMVRVGDGYEAATFDQVGHIAFWHDGADSTQWRQVGSSRYPYVPQVGAPHASARAAVLTGMAHATFVVSGYFTGDSSGNAVAFTTGAKGWGAIKAEANGNIGPSGAAVGHDQIGLSYGFAFHHGLLETRDCPANRPISDCGRYSVVKLWRWTGRDFRRS